MYVMFFYFTPYLLFFFTHLSRTCNSLPLTFYKLNFSNIRPNLPDNRVLAIANSKWVNGRNFIIFRYFFSPILVSRAKISAVINADKSSKVKEYGLEIIWIWQRDPPQLEWCFTVEKRYTEIYEGDSWNHSLVPCSLLSNTATPFTEHCA